MCRLNEQLQYFVTMKISTDSLWQDVTVILSGHETPGEGEHKIMDFIRHGKCIVFLSLVCKKNHVHLKSELLTVRLRSKHWV